MLSILLLILATHAVMCDVEQSPVSATSLAQEAQEAMITIHYVDEDIINIINALADKKKVNVVLPTGANALKIKVNFSLTYKVTIDRAWDLLVTYLDMAGYSLLPKNSMYIIVKNNKENFDVNNARFPTRLFIETPLDDLPSTAERITYLYYFSNIKVGDSGDNRIKEIATQLLPDQSFFRIDPATNSILVTAKSFDIKSFMELVTQVDHSEYKEKLQLIPLRYAMAEDVARVFNEQILKTMPQTGTARFRADLKKPSEDSYFPESIKIIPYKDRNALIAMGRAQAIERVRDFVFKYIDVELESGKSMLHVYRLQYLDASTFAPILKRIVTSSAAGGTGQSVGGTQHGGTERFFGDVVIVADKPLVQKEGTQYAGSNKLVIAARSDDWKRIEALIEQLDRPQPQVIIEVLIADLTLNDSKQIATQFRNPTAIPLPGSISMQAANLMPVVIDAANGDLRTDATTVATDLLGQSIKNAGAPSGGTCASGINAAGVCVPTQISAPGATVLQMADADGKTWSLMSILSSFNYFKILSHPHAVVSHNREAVMKSEVERNVVDNADPSTAGTVIQNKKIKAALTVKVTPRISAADEVTLKIDIKIDDFTEANSSTPQSGNRQQRALQTNAYMKSGEVLALGGLVKTNNSDSINDTPILSKIPILGWFFKGRSDVETQTSLSVFILPTIIRPKLRSGIDEYTQTYAELTKDYAQEESLFQGLKDPITHWFFTREIDVNKAIDTFIAPKEPSYAVREFKEAENKRPAVQQSPVGSMLQSAQAAPMQDRLNERASMMQEILAQAEEPKKRPINTAVAQAGAVDEHLSKRAQMLRELLEKESAAGDVQA